MWALEEIERMNEERGEKAREKELEPYIFRDADDAKDWPPFPFPPLGDECDNVELEHLDSLFCDSSGFGAPGEPALTVEQLKTKLVSMLNEHGPLAIAIGEVGQFQLYVEIWKADA